MRRIYHMTGHTIGMSSEERALAPSTNHFKSASLTKKLAWEIHELGLRRVAGNIYTSRSVADFWKVHNGKIIRITQTEVDNGEEIQAAPVHGTADFLEQVLGELTF